MEALNAVIASIDRTKTIEEQQAVDAYAEALENAIAALVRKPVPADYQGVEELLGKIPKDLSIYTEKSVKALNAAKEAIVWDLDDSRQEEVDQFAENLKAALDGLTLKPADYSAVDAALAKVSNDLSIYTEESIQPLQTAINSVESGKTILDQAEVCTGRTAGSESRLFQSRGSHQKDSGGPPSVYRCVCKSTGRCKEQRRNRAAGHRAGERRRLRKKDRGSDCRPYV